MSGKRVKKIDPDHIAKRNVDNTKFAQQIERKIKSKIENLDPEDYYCAIDNCKCSGRCRERNTNTHGEVVCSEIIAKP